MILEKNNSAQIVRALERATNLSCPWQVDKITLWCEKVVTQLVYNPLLSLNFFQGEIKANTKEVSGNVERRLSATWIGEPCSFFGEKHRDNNSDFIDHVTASNYHYLMKDVFVYSFYQFGPIVFNKENEIIKQLSTPFYPLLALEQNFPRHYEDVIEPICAISDRFNEANFAHWLLDTIPRIAGVELFEDKNITYLCHKVVSKWQDEMLLAYDIPFEKRMELESRKLYRFHKIVLPKDFGGAVPHPASKANFNCIKKIRGQLKSQFSDEFDVLIIERGANRRLINQYLLIDAFKAKGMKVKVVDTSNLTFVEQRALFNQAKIVIGVHGAALASSVFMQEGSVLFELLPLSYGNPAFWIVSSSIGVKYFGVTDLQEVGDNIRPRLKDIILNNSAIEGILNVSVQHYGFFDNKSVIKK